MLGAHLTPQARVAFESADDALYLVTDAATAAWLTRLRPDARSLHGHYRLGRPRREAYEAMVDELVRPLPAGRSVCAAFYGHPGVFVYPGNEALRRARSAGFPARMLPAVSALDCLFADLGVDPATGCQIYHASDLLDRDVAPETRATLLLLQISVVSQPDAVSEPDWSRLGLLVDHLLRFYPATHEVVAYEAAVYPILTPTVVRCALAELARAPLSTYMTLVVPPLQRLA